MKKIVKSMVQQTIPKGTNTFSLRLKCKAQKSPLCVLTPWEDEWGDVQEEWRDPILEQCRDFVMHESKQFGVAPQTRHPLLSELSDHTEVAAAFLFSDHLLHRPMRAAEPVEW